MAFIIFYQVAGHLQRRIQDDPVRYLARQRGLYIALRIIPVPRLPSGISDRPFIVNIEYSRCIVHRARQQSHEGERAEIFRTVPGTPGIPLHAFCTLPCHHVRPCTADTGLLDRLVDIEHQPVLRSLSTTF